MDFIKRATDRLLGKYDASKEGESENNLEKIESPGEQPNDELKLVNYIREKVQEIRNSGSRVASEGIWMTNYAYLMGFDSVYYDTASRQYRVIGRASGSRGNRLQVNKVLPSVQRRQARLCKNPPKWEIRPDDSSQEAKDKARLEKDLLAYYIDKERVLQKRQEMMPGLMQCGHYYMAIHWNKEKGQLLSAEQTKVTDEGNTEITQSDSEYEGDIEVELVSAFEIFPDPVATSLDNAQYYIQAKVRKLDYFRSHYPERGALVKEEDTWLLSIQNEMRINSMVGQGPAQTGIGLAMKNSAIELTLYEKRSKDYPNGRMVVSANGVLLYDGELPCGEFPHVKWDDVQITQKYYSEALVTHMRPIQDQYNILMRKRAQWTNTMLAGKWLAPKGSSFQENAPNNQSGEVWYYNPVPGAPAPQQQQVPVIPQYAYSEEDRLLNALYDILGEGEISRGILPAAGIPAIGMQLLLEQDETRISTVTEQHEYAFAKVGKLMLKYLEKYVTNERMLKISDPNAQYQVKSWTGNDLSGDHDVIVVRGSTAPTTLATKRNEILNLYDRGMYGNPADSQVRIKVMRDLEFGDTSSHYADQSADFAQINKSIHEIEMGIIPDISEFDNHALHLQEKNRYRKSDKFTNLDPEKQAILMNDMEEHLRELMKITAPQFGMTVSPTDQVEPAAVEMAKNMDDEAKQSAQEQLLNSGTGAQ